MNKTEMFRAVLTACRRANSHFFDRGLTIAAEVEPVVFAREALHRIRYCGRTSKDRDDVLAFLAFAAPLVPRGTGEFCQDLWALWEAGGKRNGYFVEFGAAGGKEKSNSYFLEKEMGWDGVVAEPNPHFIESTRRERSCVISDKCVYSRSGERIKFLATRVPELSRVAAIDPNDNHDRSAYETVSVETISLNDLLAEGGAPRDIDFLSIDTEGSEHEILSHFDFDRWNIHAIAVEHNFTAMREKVFDLLRRYGYRRKWPQMSYVDDWYVRG